MDIKKKIIIKGQRVHDVGYRPFLLGIAESLEIERFFAKNILVDEKQTVHVLVDSSEEKVEAFIDSVSSEYPEKSQVENVEVEDFIGNVMKIENYYRYLTSMQLSKIAMYGGKMLEKQDQMLGKQDQMLGKQDQMLGKQDQMLGKQDQMLGKQDMQTEIIKNGFNDLKDEIKTGLNEIKVEVRTGSSEIKHEIQMLRDDFKEMFMRRVDELHIEINEIKAILARMQVA